MKHARKLHVLALVFGWLFALAWGTFAMVVVVGGLAALELVLWRLDLAQPTGRRLLQLPPRRRQSATPYVDAVRQEILLSTARQREFDFTLRRRLERIAASRLTEHHGVDIHRDPRRARELLGDEAWELLDPARPVIRSDASGRVPQPRLVRIVDRLESL